MYAANRNCRLRNCVTNCSKVGICCQKRCRPLGKARTGWRRLDLALKPDPQNEESLYRTPYNERLPTKGA
jgi:hypothetical protein